MNPPCARCNKTVYPVEKLSCLDKCWHKGCFTCETCNIKLTMKTYKGYNKIPYCVTHYPTTRFTSVADTPENKRLAKQTKNQSDLAYHKDHVDNLRNFHQVSDTPALQTTKRTQQIASQVNYASQAPTNPQQNRFPDEQQRFPSGGFEPAAAPMPAPGPPRAPGPPPPQTPSVPKYVAVYDYVAADDDEVSFNEGDFIVNSTVIDDGWMEGTVERTGKTGMLPSNYVERS